MTYARAGHTPLIYVPGAVRRRRDAAGADSGARRHGRRTANSTTARCSSGTSSRKPIPLQPGDLYLLFTDGISEAMNAHDDLFGESRLGRLVETHAHLPSEELRERVLREIAAFVGDAPQHDDMTMILLKMDDLPAAHRRESSAAVCGAARSASSWPTSSSSSAPIPTSRRRSSAACSKRHGMMSVLVVRHAARDLPALRRTASSAMRISVHADDADEAQRIIDAHRTELRNGQVVRLRDEFETLQQAIGYRFRDRGLLEHAMTHTSRANEDVSGGVRDNESMEFLGDAVLGFVVADMLFREFPQFDEGRSRRSRRRWCRRRRWRGRRSGCGSAITCCSGAAKRRPAAAANRRCSPTPTKR